MPSLAHALEEARAALNQERRRVEAAEPDNRLSKRAYKSLLDVPVKMTGAPTVMDKSEMLQMALEANAARRQLAGGPARGDNIEGRIEEIKTALDECLHMMRECRDLMRAMASRRDRNYF
ncbi:MAG: hypothetical protein KF874_13800 [Rhizobiaceae bacterium]|nr:hypothetical protein [Rhizobiaceae bacterium]